jgi:hypothetical protein
MTNANQKIDFDTKNFILKSKSYMGLYDILNNVMWFLFPT